MTLRVRRGAGVSLVVATMFVVAAGCSGGVISGRAVSIYADPFSVGGLPATSGPSGLRPGVPPANLAVSGYDGNFSDVLAVDAVDDIQAYWADTYPTLFKGRFRPVTELISWDASATRSQSPDFCGESTFELSNAGYCSLDNTIGWDRGSLLPAMIDGFGPMSVVMVLAHEYGHAIQTRSGLVGDDDPTIVAEQQADCFAGAFMRHVAEGKSEHFTLNTSDGLNQVLAATVAVRDTDPGSQDSVHGSAFERVTAAQIGFSDGPSACAKIDENNVEARRANLPRQFEGIDDTGELPVTRESLDVFFQTFQQVLPTSPEPTVDYSGSDIGCADAAATSPVSYCPSTNTIGVDVAAMAERGTPSTYGDDELPSSVTGDYTAYVLFVSRYALAIQNAAGQSMKDAQTGLRSACLSGVMTALLSPDNLTGNTGTAVTLSAGDLDEAVSGLLTDGLAASDADGFTVPSGFARVDAFRTGVLGGRASCDRY